ncbi:MAG: hypothetical protein AAF845_01930 [Bacteroidota bacterium]
MPLAVIGVLLVGLAVIPLIWGLRAVFLDSSSLSDVVLGGGVAVVTTVGMFLSAVYWVAMSWNPASPRARWFWWTSAVFNLVAVSMWAWVWVESPNAFSGALVLWVAYVAAVSLYNATHGPEADGW